MAGFQDVVVDCDFVDLGFSGLPYTWDNRQEGAQNVEAPLDRAFGDHRFLDAMGDLAVKVLPIAFSDHAVVLVEVRYEHMWQRHVFDSVRNKLKSLQDELEKERSSTLYRRPTERERSLMRELVETLAREEEMNDNCCVRSG